MPKKPSRKTLVKKLDKVFSQYIRRRFAVNEIAKCVTCGKQAHWKDLQAGHFMSRKHYSTRWMRLMYKYNVVGVTFLDTENNLNLECI